MHAVRAIARSSIGRAILQIAACALGPHACVAASGALTLASGGSLKEAILAAGISFMQIGAYTTVGGVVSNVSAASGAIAAGATKLALHAVVGGAIAMAQGGDFATGALTGSISAGASLMTDASGIMGTSGDGDFGNMMARTTVSAVAGGTASVLAGGKFANGAITGAFAQMYNAEGFLDKMFAGTDAHQTLGDYLKGRDPGRWQSNTGLGGDLDGGRADLVFDDTNLFELKTLGGAAAGATQLGRYIASCGYCMIGDFNEVFQGMSINLPSTGFVGNALRGVFGVEMRYNYKPSHYPGVITYETEYDTTGLFRAFKNAPKTMPLPSPGGVRFPR